MLATSLTTTANGNDLWLESYPSGLHGARCALYLFSIHGDERAAIDLAPVFVDMLRRQCPPPGLDVLVVPSANPDGVACGERGNARGVDLNRNFPASNWTRKAASPRYDPGHAPASERETRAIVNLLDRVHPAFVVSVHSPLACINYDGPGRDLASAVATAVGLPLTEHIGYPTPGSLGSYVGIDKQIPTITAELPASVDAATLHRWSGALLALAAAAP